MKISKITLSCVINTMGVRPKLPDTRKAKLVCQAEFAITSANSKLKLIKTTGFGECVILSLISPSKRTGGLVHFDIRTLVKSSFEAVILPEFYKRGCRDLRAQIVGGLPTEASTRLVREIRDALFENKIRITGIDINNPIRSPGLILNTVDLKLYDIAKPLLPEDAETLRRYEAASWYIVKNPTERLIRLVE